MKGKNWIYITWMVVVGGTCTFAADKPTISLNESPSSKFVLISDIKDGDLFSKIVVPDPAFVPRCLAHCAIRTIQETRAWCSMSDRPAHIGGWENAWTIHEEIRLIQEEVYVDSTCNETIVNRTETLLNAPLYWPEDDIYNPVPYYESELVDFDCGDYEYDPTTNETEPFVYRIVAGYKITSCSQ